MSGTSSGTSIAVIVLCSVAVLNFLFTHVFRRECCPCPVVGSRGVLGRGSR